MATSFPKLPGYVPTHDCTQTQWAKTSHKQLEKKVNAFEKPTPAYPVPDAPAEEFSPEKADVSLSTSQRFFKNPTGTGDIQARFEPTFVKLDKVVLKFDGYFKESVVESNLENWRKRRVIIFYYLEDSTIMINEPKQTNSGTPQGVFLKRQAVKRADGDFIQPSDFHIGSPIHIYGREIVITDADKYTRDFFTTAIGAELGPPQTEPTDEWAKSQEPVATKKDRAMMDFLEHSLGGGKVASQKQFLDNDRKVLKFNAVCDDAPYVIHFYLADDTIEVREIHFKNNGKDQFPMLLKRSRVPKAFYMT